MDAAGVARVMIRDEIRAALKANNGKRVRLTYTDGEMEIVNISSVDDEGFVHSGPNGENQDGFWTRFESVSNVSTQF
jgi:hypothetical protein